MSSAYLTDVQQKVWQNDGFLILKNVLSPTEIEALLEAVDSVIENLCPRDPNSTTRQSIRKGCLYDYPSD